MHVKITNHPLLMPKSYQSTIGISRPPRRKSNMRKHLAVFNSDRVNKYRMVFTIKALVSGLEQSWEIGVPSFISHDCHRPIAWSKGLSLYFEPGMVRLAGIVFLPESQEDSCEILQATKDALGSRISKYFTEYGKELKSKIPKELFEITQPHVAGCAALIGDNLAAKLFPNLFSKIDKDGLIPLSDLNPVGPGVFERDGLLLFAHQFFRRSLSRLNSLNEPFLKIIQELSTKPKINAKILLDRDMVGLAKSYLPTIELEYWWGPKFDKNLSKIPTGVTTYKASKRDCLFYGISRTEIWWHLQNQTKTLECEELRDISSFGLGVDKFGCRYVHSIIDPSNSEPFHLDGAIRLYNDESMIERLDKDISRSGRHTDYFKLWRLDGALDIEIWKKTITHYYRDNSLIGEYLGGRDDAEPLPQIAENHSESRYSRKYIPCEVSKGSGVRISVSYRPIVKASEQPCYALSLDSFLKNTTRIQYIESDTIELCKFIEKKNGMMAIPSGIALVAFEDMLTNFPLIQHTGLSARNLAQLTHNAVKELCNIWKKQGHDRIVTYNIGVQYVHKNICFSIAGHVDDLSKWHSSETCNLPTSEEDLGDWCNSVAEFISSNGSEVYDNPPIEDLLKLSGLLVVQRTFIDPSLYKLKYNDEQLLISFEMPTNESEIELLNSIKEDNLKVASAWLLNESLCSKCNSLYTSCGCSKYSEDDVREIMHNVELLGAFWTKNKA